MYNLNKPVIIERVRQLIPTVKLIYLFGSFAQGEQHADSDLDIVILPVKALDRI